VWPAVHAKFSQMRYKIIGKGVPSALEKKWNSIPGVEVLGYVSDSELDRLYEESLVVVAPILSGAGTCIKVLEAGLRQRFVYATSFARRGLVGSESYCLNLDVETLLATLPRLKAHELSPHAPDERALKDEFESIIIRTMKRVRNGN
jgi:glycosyltransferase involved in cell wall biosynthesis